MPVRKDNQLINLLVICRSRDVAKNLASLLGSGYAITWAEPGCDAMELLRRHRWHAVVVEANGPDSRAASLVHDICSHPDLDGAPVVAVGEERDGAAALNAGASSFVAAARDVAELAARVRNLVRLGRFRQGPNARRQFLPTFGIWPDPVLVIDPSSGRVFAANDAATETFRLSSPLTALCATQRTHGPAATSRRERPGCQTVSLPGTAGGMRTVETLSAPIRWGRKLACLHILRHLSPPRLSACGDQSEYERLRATIASMSGLAHDFGSVLMSLQSGLDLIASELSPESLRILGIVQTSVDAATEMARRISRLAKGGDCADAQSVVLGDALTRLRPMLQGALRGVSLEVIDRSEGASVLADPFHLDQILLNLVSNAGRACQKQDTVTIRAWHEQASVCLSVTDTGCGIPAEVMDRIFEPYFTTRSGDGTGLGLAIVRHLIIEQGGRIHVSSGEGSGTTFLIEWPRHAPAASDPIAPPPMTTNVAPYFTEVHA